MINTGLFLLLVNFTAFNAPVVGTTPVGYVQTDLYTVEHSFTSVETCELYADAFYEDLENSDEIEAYDVQSDCLQIKGDFTAAPLITASPHQTNGL